MSQKKMTAKEEQFCQEYLIDLNGTQAAIRAGYSPNGANAAAARLLANVSIQNRIADLNIDRSKRTQITQDMVLVELARIGFSDLRNMMDDNGHLLPPSEWEDATASAISSIEVVTKPTGVTLENGKKEVEHIHKIKVWDKNSALEKLAKHLGMLVDRKEIGRPGDFSNLSNAQLIQRAEALGVPVEDVKATLLDQDSVSVH